MHIRFKDSFSGSNIDWKAGEVRDVPDAKAQRLIDRGLAEAVSEADEAPVVRHDDVETTSLPDVAEKAVKRAPRKKRKGKRNVERP